MEKNNKSGIENDLSQLPDNLIKLIKASLDAKTASKKINARSCLVKLGKAVIPHMNKLLDSKERLLRIEAAKIIELIADSGSIPVFINLLDDEEFEIRWIAAEGLIKIGRKSIRPLLLVVRDGDSSFFQNQGIHHVLESLLYKREKKDLVSLLRTLDDYQELREIAPVEASLALNTLFKENSK